MWCLIGTLAHIFFGMFGWTIGLLGSVLLWSYEGPCEGCLYKDPELAISCLGLRSLLKTPTALSWYVYKPEILQCRKSD